MEDITQRKDQANWSALKVTLRINFKPQNAGYPSNSKITFKREDLLASKWLTGNMEDGLVSFIINRKAVTDTSLEGNLSISSNNLNFDAGAFSIDLENNKFCSAEFNVTYHTYLKIELELI